MFERFKNQILFLWIFTAYFPYLQALNGLAPKLKIPRVIWRNKVMATVVALVALLGISSNSALINIVEALFHVQNFAKAEAIVEPGITIYKYETETTTTLTDKAEFETGSSTTNQFETGFDDIIAFDDTDDYFTLNHYGANEPNTDQNGDWWDDDTDDSTKYNWKYRQCFDIDHTAGTTNLVEYQLYLDFDTVTEISGGRMQSEGQDIRFVDTSGNLIDHYIADEINTNTTRIWIQPDLITAGTTKTYCMYYGNPSVTSTSNREAVFTYSNKEDLYAVLAENADGDTINFGSYVDNNDIIVDSYNQSYDQYEINSVSGTGSVAGNSDIRANGPIQATIQGSNIDSVVPISNAGLEFTYRMDRGAHILDFVAPRCSANVEIYNTTNLGAVVAGGSFTIPTAGSYTWNEAVEDANAFANDDAVYITSTNGCPILVNHRSTANADTFPMFPSSSEDWYGVGSNTLELSSNTTTTLSIFDSGASSPTNVTLNAANDYHTTDTGAGSQGTQPSQRIVVTSGGGIGAKSLADSDGGESATFLPRSEMDTKYIIPEAAEYLAISTIAGANTTVEIYNNASGCAFGGGAPDQTASANSTNDYPGFVRFTAIPAGACVVSNHPIAPYYEKESGDDETSLWSWKQGRQRVQVDPTTSIGTVEAGAWNLGTGDTWNSRLPVTITNNVGAAIAEYPIRVPLTGQTDLLTNAQADGGDVRIAGAQGDGTDNQDYYLEEFNNSFAGDGDLWTQTTVAGNSTQTLYIYYNSTTAQTSNANQESVFTYTSAQPLYYPVSTNTGGTFNVYSLIDNNDLFFLGVSYSGFDTGENYTDPGVTTNAQGIVNQNEIFQATGPVNAGFTNDATDAIHPLSWSGTKFLTADTRYEQEFSILAPYANSTVTFEESTGTGWAPLGAAVSLTQGVSQNVVRNTQNGTGTTPANGIRITSTTPIIVHTHGNNGAALTNDTVLVYPVEDSYEESTDTYELYGISSNAMLLTTENPTTTVEFFYADGTSSGSFNVTDAQQHIYSETGSAQGTGRGIKIVADGPISAQSQADSDGTESVTFLPKKEFAKEYLVITGTQYIAIVSDDPGTVCTVYDDLGVLAETKTLTSNAINHTTLGNTTTGDLSAFLAGYYMQCTNPVYAYYEKNGDDTNTSITDETTMISFPQARKKTIIEPIITDIDDTQVLEEGLYYESGYDSNTTALDLEASITFTIDGNTLNNPTHISWNDFDWTSIIPTQSETNNVEAVEVEVFYATDTNCATATYTSAGILTGSSDTIPITASDNSCLQVEITLRTGDEAYAPLIEDITFTYTDPMEIGDITTTNNINIDGNISATSINKRILKFVTPNTNLSNLDHELSYESGTNTADFTNFDLDLVETDTNTAINQFDYPSPGFPVTPPAVYSGNSAEFNSSTDNALYLDQARATGSASVFEIESHIYVEGSNGVVINRPYTLTISGT